MACLVESLKKRIGPMVRPDEDRAVAESALQATVDPVSPSSGLTIDPAGRSQAATVAVAKTPCGVPAGSIGSHEPAHVLYNVAYFRMRAEELGDLAIEMVAEEIEGTAYGCARRAAHYGRVALGLYAQRAEEMRASHPEFFR